MKTLAILCLVFALVACESANPTSPSCTKIDFSGSATWRLPADSLVLDMQGDFTGSLLVLLSSAGDSGRIGTGEMKGVLVTPLVENSTTEKGSLILQGILKKDEDLQEYEIELFVITGTGDFEGVSGSIYLSWLFDDELIWYGGTFCFQD